MPAMVLDSFALIAYFRGEAAGVTVKELLREASKVDTPLLMTEVNYAEVKSMIVRKDGAGAWQEAAKLLVALPIDFHPADRDLADQAADIKARVSLSLADAFAVALARRHKAELVTGDPEFAAVQGEVKVSWLPN